jgi:uncharacterized protein YegL
MTINGAYAGKTRCLPIYLLLDTSATMKPHEKLLNDTLDHIYISLASSPRVAELAQISIITFNTKPHLVMAITDIERVKSLPRLECAGQAFFGPAFDLVRERIDADIPALRAAGMAVLRPAVFLLTDGRSTDTDDWAARFQALVDQARPQRPHVLTFGFGQATKESIAGMATRAAFLAKNNTLEKAALTRILMSLLNTVMAAAPADEFTVPTSVPGFERVPVEYMKE